MPNRLISPVTRLPIISSEPLDLSLSPLEKKVLKEFKAHIPVHEISKDSQLNIADIYKIINKTRIIKIKIDGRYSPEIKYRIQEARKLGITIKKIAKIFNLEKHRVVYIDRCNRAVLRKQLAHFITFASRGLHLRVIHRLKVHCINRFYTKLTPIKV